MLNRPLRPRLAVPRAGETGDGSRALFIGELTDFTELATLGRHFTFLCPEQGSRYYSAFMRR